MDARWHIQLFGGLRATRGAQAIQRFRTRKTGLLLACLAYRLPRSQWREELIELLWPGCDPDARRSSLSQELCWLRRQLEQSAGLSRNTVLLADRAMVQMRPEAVTTDVAEFGAALQAAARVGNGSERVSLLAEAVGLYRGPLLAGCGDEWVLRDREWLAERYFGALHALIAHLEGAGDLSGALQYAQQGVNHDPLREDAHGELIRLCAAAGQATAALRHYRELERILHQELGSTPAVATQALAQAIIHRADEPLRRNGAGRLRGWPPPAAGPRSDARSDTAKALLRECYGLLCRIRRAGPALDEAHAAELRRLCDKLRWLDTSPK